MLMRRVGSGLILLLLATGCSIGAAESAARDGAADPTPRIESAPTTEPLATTEPSPIPAPTGSDTSPTTEPSPAPTAPPTPSDSPTPDVPPLPDVPPTPDGSFSESVVPGATIDNSTIVMSGEDWQITEQGIDDMVEFIEATHGLEFRGPVRIDSDDEIGADVLAGHEPFPEADWYVLQLLGIVDPDADRNAVNQFRRDRVRGVCCRYDEGVTVATVEPQPTRLETEVIIVHELTHALHAQYPELIGGGRNSSDEFPSPNSAAREGVPQLVAQAWLERAPEAERVEAAQRLPVVTEALAEEIGAGPAQILNFAYATAPVAFAPLFAADGPEALMDWLADPPETTEQVLFADRWLEGDEAVGVRSPELPAGSDPRRSGTLGAALVFYALADHFGEPVALDIASAWTGGTWTLYRPSGGEPVCLATRIAMDGPERAETLADRLARVLSADATFEVQPTVLEAVTVVELDTCGLAA